MAITLENIISIKDYLRRTDYAVFMLTEIFFVDCPVKDISVEMIRVVQKYVIEMSKLIPEIRIYLDMIETGLFDHVDQTTKRFESIEEYVKINYKNCEELLKEIGLIL